MQINVFQYLYIILLTFAKVLQKLPDCKKISTEHCIDYYNHLITNRLPSVLKGQGEEVLRGWGRFSFFWSHNSLHLPHPTPFALQNLTSYAPEPHFLSSQTYFPVSPNLPFSSAPDNQHITEP